MEDEGEFDPGAGIEEQIDTTVPHSARIWNYWLGGKDNYAVDQRAGDQFREIYPDIAHGARAARHFLARAVRHLAGPGGVGQFLDIGTGLPNVDNTHQIAQRVNPRARVVYVDNDPLVLLHARALLTATPGGVTEYVAADLRDPDRIVREAARSLDLERPVALMLMGVLGHIESLEEARAIAGRLMEQLPSGSYLVHYDSTDTSPAYVEALRLYNEGGSLPYILRSPGQIARFFDGLELLAPGVVSCTRWRPEAEPFGEPVEVDQYGGVGRKP